MILKYYIRTTCLPFLSQLVKIVIPDNWALPPILETIVVYLDSDKEIYAKMLVQVRDNKKGRCLSRTLSPKKDDDEGDDVAEDDNDKG